MRFGIKYIYVQNKDMNLFKYDIKRRASFNVTKNAVKSGNAVFLCDMKRGKARRKKKKSRKSAEK